MMELETVGQLAATNKQEHWFNILLSQYYGKSRQERIPEVDACSEEKGKWSRTVGFGREPHTQIYVTSRIKAIAAAGSYVIGDYNGKHLCAGPLTIEVAVFFFQPVHDNFEGIKGV